MSLSVLLSDGLTDREGDDITLDSWRVHKGGTTHMSRKTTTSKVLASVN
jgi:hypothetical protein